jgi:hypothetical protein
MFSIQVLSIKSDMKLHQSLTVAKILNGYYNFYSYAKKILQNACLLKYDEAINESKAPKAFGHLGQNE